MASPNTNLKIHEHSIVVPPSSSPISLPLTFFDLLWLRFHPVERIFFYSLPLPLSDSISFFDKVIPKLKSSLSLTLQHFLPLAGNIVWPSDSENPIIRYSPGDGVSLFVAESDAEFNHVLDNSPHEALESRCFVPHFESSDSFASVLSLQITLFPNTGFCIGISTHHAILDGKSSTLFLKAWASLCNSNEDSPSLNPELEPFFDREVIKDPSNLGEQLSNYLKQSISKLFPNEVGKERSLKILPSQPKLEDSVRATFELTRQDLEKIKKRVLSNWEKFDIESDSIIPSSKPPTLSSFVVTCAYSLVCIAKAIHGVDKERQKFVFGFTMDCRARLDDPIPENYFGNCVWSHLVDTQSTDFKKEDGLIIVAKNIHNKVKTLEKGCFGDSKKVFDEFKAVMSERVEIMGVAGSNRFGVYGIDFGWGRPEKVEITSVDKGLTIGLAESKDGKGGIQVELVLNKNVMDLFSTLFHGGLCVD